MQRRKIEQFDFIFISGDAYVDHPSFGSAVILRRCQSWDGPRRRRRL
ncbi:MAG: hypothetical protein GX301_13520 [Gracilibacteraceae bacterium]|nr:hypothetical protein [Gracilibacteraceae bacterium]